MSEEETLFGWGERATAPYQKHSPTSKAAAKAIEPVAGTQRARVLATIRRSYAHGVIDEEIQLSTGLKVQSETPRRVELVDAGLVKDSGRVRKTTADRDAVVWIATSKEEQERFIPKEAKESEYNRGYRHGHAAAMLEVQP